MCSIFSKVLDLIVLMRYSDKLESSRLQFGFKAKRSTAMCTMIVKEMISYYVKTVVKLLVRFYMPRRRLIGLSIVSCSICYWHGSYTASCNTYTAKYA